MIRSIARVSFILSIIVFSGCSTIYFEKGSKTTQELEYEEWHHDGILGLVEFSPAVDMHQRCGGKEWTGIRVEETFVQGLFRGVTYNLYDPWDVAYSCQK